MSKLYQVTLTTFVYADSPEEAEDRTFDDFQDLLQKREITTEVTELDMNTDEEGE